MHPVLFNIGPLTVHSYGVFVALGFLAGLALTVWLARSEGIAPGLVMDMGIVILVAALAGSRLLYVFMNLSFYLKEPLGIFRLWEGGLVFSGGIVAALAAMAFYLRRHDFSFWKTGDVWAPGIALGQAVGRVGCLMAGCCYGLPAYQLPWAVVFTDPACLAPTGIPLHPAQIYSAFSGLAVSAVVLAVYFRKKYHGQALIWFVILHSTARLAIERFRWDDRGAVFGSGMTVTQLVTLTILAGAVATIFFRKNRADGGGK